jgi:hypothetical protein
MVVTLLAINLRKQQGKSINNRNRIILEIC